MTASEPTLRLGARARRRALGRVAPWLAWSAAALLALWFARDVVAVGVAPAEAERRTVVVSSPRTAVVVELKVSAGDLISGGDLVAVLDPSEADVEIAVAETELERLRLEVGAEAGTRHEQALVTRERLMSDAGRAAVEVARLEADLGRDRAEVGKLDEQIARQAKLVAEGLASGATLDELELRRAALGTKVEEYAALAAKAKSYLVAARARVEEWEKTGKVSEPAVAPLHVAVRAQEARVAALKLARERLAVKAPASGRVAAVHVFAGGTASAGVPLVTLIDERPRRAVAWLPEDRAQLVAVGDDATLSPSDGIGPRRAATVIALGPGIEEMPLRFRQLPTEPEQARAVYLLLDDAGAPPLPGQAFDARFSKGRARP